MVWIFNTYENYKEIEEAERRAQALAQEEQDQRANLEQQRKVNESAATKAEREARMKAAVRELEDWASASPEACTAAKDPDACKALENYVSTYKAGSVHLQEAQAILAEAAPRVRPLQDERAWNASRSADCKKPKKWDDCQGVESYLQSFPQGIHGEEARTVIKSSERTTAALWAIEERRRLQEDRLAEQKRLAEERASNAHPTQEPDDEGTVEVHRRGRARVRAPVWHGGKSSGGKRRHRKK